MNCEFRNNISLEFKEDHIDVVKCCAKRHLPSMKSYTIEEFNNLDLLSEIKSFKGKSDGLINLSEIFKNWKFPPTICNDTKVCYFPNEEIKTIQLDLLTGCNAKCSFCCENYGEIKNDYALEHLSSNFKLTKELFFNTLYRLKGAHLDMIKFSEIGEPLLYLKEVKDYFKEVSIEDTKKVTIITNGHNLDDEFLDIISKSPINVLIGISLNAGTPETRKKVVGLDDFEYVCGMINKLRELEKTSSNVSVGILYTVCEENRNEVKICKELFSDISFYASNAI